MTIGEEMMTIDSDKLLFFLEKQMNHYLNAGTYKIIDIWENLHDGELEYGELEGIPTSLYEWFREGLVTGLQVVKNAVEDAKEHEWSILR